MVRTVGRNLKAVYDTVEYPKTEGLPTRGWKSAWVIQHVQEGAFHLALRECSRLPKPTSKTIERMLFLSDYGLHFAERKLSETE